MNIKNNIVTYSAGIGAALALAGGIAVSSAYAEISANAAAGVHANLRPNAASISADASTSMRVMPPNVRPNPGARPASTTRMSSTTREEKMTQRQDEAVSKIDTRSATEITVRIKSLNTLLARVNAMTKLSAGEKTTITTEVQNLISELTTLQAKTQVDASSTPTGSRGDVSSTSPLRMDMQSITKDYRVYALVIPQIQILAAVDRGQTLITSLTTLSAKLQTRISAASASGHDVAALQTSLVDLNAKVSDAQTQLTAAVSATANLTPDNGDAIVATSNEAALKIGRADIQAANADIKAATADAKSIVKAIVAFGGGSVSASTSASASASTSAQ